jgi:hypothetical protein
MPLPSQGIVLKIEPWHLWHRFLPGHSTPLTCWPWCDSFQTRRQRGAPFESSHLYALCMAMVANIGRTKPEPIGLCRVLFVVCIGRISHHGARDGNSDFDPATDNRRLRCNTSNAKPIAAIS